MSAPRANVFWRMLLAFGIVAVAGWFVALRLRRVEVTALAAATDARRDLAAALRQAEERAATAERKKRSTAEAVAKGAPPAAGATDAKPVPAPRPRTMSEIIAASPALELIELERQHAAVKQDHDRFFRQERLSPEQIEKFRANWVKRAEAWMDLQAVGRAQGEAGTATIAALQAKADADYEAAQRALLGPEGFQRLEDYNRTIGAYNVLVRGLAGATAIEGIPLAPEQGERLLAAALAASRGTMARGEVDLKALDWPAFEQQARQILTPAQLALFQSVEPPSGFRGRWKHQLDAAVQRALEQERAAGPGR